jgi:hypothetical protein
MTRKKSTRRNAEPRDAAQEIEAQAAPEATEPVADGKPISKADAVRDALARGKSAPDDGVAYVKKIHGIDISKQMFSSYKTQEKSRRARHQGAAYRAQPGRGEPREAIEGYLAPPAKKAPQGEGDLLAAMEAMKPLVDSLGADKVHRLVDLLG